MTRSSIDKQITCVRREIAMRKRVYPQRIEMQRMSQAQADEQIALMQDVLQTLLDVLERERPSLPLTAGFADVHEDQHSLALTRLGDEG